MSWFDQQGMFWHDTRLRMRLWKVSKATSCTEWGSGWIGKVSEVWCGMERYLICRKSCSNQLMIGSRE
jgi:hypothetical protein